MYYLQSTLLISLVFKAFSFNLDTNNVIVYLDPYKFNNVKLNKSSYFGYSISLYGGSETDIPWIQIGAPRGGNHNSNTGVVFRCEIENVCKEIDVTEGAEKSKLFPKNKPNKNGAWIGQAMDVSESLNRVVICGHRWIQINRSPYTYDYWMQGACYWSHLNDSLFHEIVPLQDPTKAIEHKAYRYGQGSAGISVQFTNSKKQAELLLGAPGVRNWAGTAILYRDGYDSLPVASKQVRTQNKASYYSLINSDEFATVNIADARRQTNIFDLFGYAVASGYFFNKNELLYVTSAPKSLKYYGQILVYKFANESEQTLNVKDSKRGQQFGEYFGSSITAGDINSDGYDDIVVGAPYHSNSKYNEGRIYVFFGSRKETLDVPVYGSVIDGKAVNGQFGTCVSFMSDLDQDGFGDIAVSAPNENDGSGVVYVFKGTSNGLKSTPSQIIVGRDIIKEIRGFGISISRPVDIDNNKYYDVAIGAHFSGHAILFRSRPTVVIHHRLMFFVSRLEYSAESFIINACYYFDSYFHDSSIDIQRTIIVDEQLHRAFLEDDQVKFVTLHQRQISCENSTVRMKSNITNLLEPIVVTLSHEFLNNNVKKDVVYVGHVVNGTDLFCPRCAVYDTYRSSKKQTIEIPFVLGCGEDNICNTKLALETKFLLIGNNDTFILGSADFLTMLTVITNEGEKAYLMQIMIELPITVNFRSVPSNCIEQNSFNITCNIDNPLRENKTKTLTLDLDMKDVNSGKFQEDIIINVTVLTSSRNKAKHKQIVPLKLVRQADITVTGKSGQQSYSYENLTSDKLEFTQIYQIEKTGASPIDEVLIEIKIPKYFHTPAGLINFNQFYQPEGYLAGQPIKCRSDNTFIMEKENEDDMINLNEENVVNNRMRIKRDIQMEINEVQTEFQLLANRTFYINCSKSDVNCVSLFCSMGPFKKRQNIAVIQIKMLFDAFSLKDLLGIKNIIAITTEGKVTINDVNNFTQNIDSPKLTQVSSIFIGGLQKTPIDWWIIILSIIAGLLLLLLLIMALIKAGFFKRTAKLELEALKTAETNQDLILADEKQELELMDEETVFKAICEIQSNDAKTND